MGVLLAWNDRPSSELSATFHRIMAGQSSSGQVRIFGCSGVHNLGNTGARPAGTPAHAAGAPGHYKRIISLVMPGILWIMRPPCMIPHPSAAVPKPSAPYADL
jgi:hypothetical protein